VNTGLDLEASQNYGSKVLAKNLSNTTLKDFSTELAVEEPRASAFNTPILVAILNLSPEVYRSVRLKC